MFQNVAYRPTVYITGTVPWLSMSSHDSATTVWWLSNNCPTTVQWLSYDFSMTVWLMLRSCSVKILWKHKVHMYSISTLWYVYQIIIRQTKSPWKIQSALIYLNRSSIQKMTSIFYLYFSHTYIQVISKLGNISFYPHKNFWNSIRCTGKEKKNVYIKQHK